MSEFNFLNRIDNMIKQCEDHSMWEYTLRKLRNSTDLKEYCDAISSDLIWILTHGIDTMNWDLFTTHCDWGNINKFALLKLFLYQPQTMKQCKWDQLDVETSIYLLTNIPEIKDIYCNCDWTKLNSQNWYDLLMKQPRFLDCCIWDNVNIKHQSLLLKEYSCLEEYV